MGRNFNFKLDRFVTKQDCESSKTHLFKVNMRCMFVRKIERKKDRKKESEREKECVCVRVF